MLDIVWHAIDRDLWPVGSWSLRRPAPRPTTRTCAKGRGKTRDAIRDEAIWVADDRPELSFEDAC